MLVNELTVSITSRKELIDAIEYILSTCDDSLILSELMRLINAGVCSTTARKEWISLSIKNSSILLSTLMNTLNETLIERLSSLIVNLISIQPDDSEKWREKGLIEIIVDLMVQSEHGPARFTFLRSF